MNLPLAPAPVHFDPVSRIFVALAAFAQVVCALVVLATVPAGATGSGDTPAAAAAGTSTDTGTIRWQSCRRGFECGSISVPVDYATPNGEQTTIAVSRRRALDPMHRLGSLVFNFGGPGDPGAETLRSFVAAVPRRIQDRYDLVSFDPRGTGGSRAIDCVSDKVADRFYGADPTPTTDAELRAFYNGTQGNVDFIAGCIAKNGTWLARVGSRNVARDLDRLRAALGSDRLNYLGYSYGTVIGSVYAQEFPERVGRMVFDGPVDLSADDAGDLDDATASFERALGAFLRHCAKSDACAFQSNGHPRAALRALRDRFEDGLTLPTYGADGRRETRRAGVAAFYTGVLSGLYDKDSGWPNLADALHLATRGDGTFLQLLADSYNGRRDDGTYDSLAESSGIIVCADQPEPLESYEQFVDEYHQAQKDYPFLGGYATDVPVGCDPRLPQPAESEVLSDVRVSGADPILVVGTTGDPATPYAGAKDLVQRLDGSRLLTFVATEHTAYTKSACINDAVDRYLLTGRLPRVGARCRR
jgi:pimeloyl-ACP methyl ester carboxylesterase